MKKKSIHECRETAAYQLAERKSNGTYEEAKSLMNAYYRLCAFEDTLLIMQNTAEIYDPRRLEKAEEKERKWYAKLNEKFKEYDAELIYFGYFPSICKLGTTRDLDLAFFYN